MPEKYFLTTPIYYVNARPHIGHAYTTIVADVLARRHRLLGEDVFFLTGTDEHGQKIERSAAAAGIPPQQFADQVSATFRELWKRMGITQTYTDFIRTTEPRHHRAVQKLFQALEANGNIYLSSYTGQYCISEEMFVEGPPGTIGPDGRPTETVSEENYFFKLSEYQLPLLNLIESEDPRNRLVIEPPSRRNEVLSFLCGNISEAILKSQNSPEVVTAYEEHLKLSQVDEFAFRAENIQSFAEHFWPHKSKYDRPYVLGALKDLSISRSSFTWGIPVPGNERHVVYVWLDALANYMTAVGYGSDDPLDIEKFAKYWPADLHIVGKEIIRFHCVYWPAFLLALRPPDTDESEWIKKMIPKKVVAHGWLLFEDSKMSKSKGNIRRTESVLDGFGEYVYAKDFPESTKEERDLFAADVLRYFLLREIPFGQDGSFSFEAMRQRYNAELTNGYGNLVKRTLTMILKEFAGVVPTASPEARTKPLFPVGDGDRGRFGWEKGSRGEVTRIEDSYHENLEGLRFSIALGGVSDQVSMTDQYINSAAPWKIEPAEFPGLLEEILYTAAESIRIITALLYPFLPFATASVWRQLGLGDIEVAAKSGELNNLQWGGLKPGTKLGPLSPIFPRAPKELAQIMTDMEAAQARPLATITTQADAATPTATEFPVTSLASETFTSPEEHHAPTDPAAGPRTATLPEPSPGTLVAGSAALTTERPGTPPHTEAQPSGIFAHQPTDQSNQITIDDFAKVELRVAKILVAERIPKADKLLRLEVDLGYERRQILSGIAEWYTPEDLLGRRIVVITNLAPRKMRGLESHGMLLAASASEGGKPSLATFPDTDDLPLGARLK